MDAKGFINGLADLMDQYKVERLLIKPHNYIGVNFGTDPIIEIMNKNEQWTKVILAKELIEQTESGNADFIEVSTSELRALAKIKH